MTTTLRLRCDGCDAETETERFQRQFHSFSGRGYGFGVWKTPEIDGLVEPTGWQWSDPVTSCTYCPKCWAEIAAEAAGNRRADGGEIK